MKSEPDAANAAAFVSVELDWDELEPRVSIETPGSDASAVAESIGAAAVYGVRHALDVASTLPCSVRITAIGGSLAADNPTLVAAAAARAVWRALGYQPPRAIAEAIETRVSQSHRAGRPVLLSFER